MLEAVINPKRIRFGNGSSRDVQTAMPSVQATKATIPRDESRETH